MKTIVKMAILMACFLCFFMPKTATAQMFASNYNVVNNISCGVTYDIYIYDMSGNICFSTTSVPLASGISDSYNYAFVGCTHVKDVEIHVGGVVVNKASLGTPVTSISTCGGSTYTVDWGYGGTDLH